MTASDGSLRGRTFVLRPWRFSDAPTLATILNDRRVARGLDDWIAHPFTVEDGESALARWRRRSGHGFAIARQGRVIGGIGYGIGTYELRHTAFLGYGLATTHWGRGIATEAIELVVDHIFAQPDIVRIQAGVYAWNHASARVLEKNGFALEARLRRGAYKDGAFTDDLVYGRVRG